VVLFTAYVVPYVFTSSELLGARAASPQTLQIFVPLRPKIGKAEERK
jgi:hypothetical protein